MIGRCLTFVSPVTLSLKDRQLVVTFKDTPDKKHTAGKRRSDYYISYRQTIW